MSGADHPSSVTLARYLGKVLSADESKRVELHLEECVLCRAELATLREMNLAATLHDAASAPAPAGPPTEAQPAGALEDTYVRNPQSKHSERTDDISTGFELGRYVVTRRLGQGAMGQVFAAYDPRLDRNVAIKLLRADLPVVENRPLRQRLAREAQALARLSHPNVVAVHDLGEHGEQLFIAMDLVEGETLTRWMEQSHPWGEVRRIFLMAGEGLAAAHRAGLVHRDFKPDNVLVGADGVARVTDFGVSRRVNSERSSEDTVSGAGSLIGTPAYMSPEQFEGKPADHRSDQFGFCVSLFEALSGQKPFQATTLKGMSEAVHRGPPERIPSRSALPPWLERLVLKGLSPKPEARFPSMDALLLELRGPAPRRRSLALPLSVTALALLLAAGLGWMEYLRRRDDPCLHIEERVARAWDETARARVAAGARATMVPWAEDALRRIDTDFRRFLSKWGDEYADVCRELKVSSASRSMEAARQACLEARLNTFVSTRRFFENPTDRMLREGQANLAVALEGAGCGVNAWFFEVPADERRRQDFDRLYRALEVLEFEIDLYKFDRTLERLGELKREATALGFAQLTAEARLQEGRVLEERGSMREAISAFEEAAVLGEGARNDSVVARARTLVVVHLAGEFEGARAREKVPAMRAAWQRLNRDPDLLPSVLDAEAAVLRREGRFDEALAKLRKGLAETAPWKEGLRCEFTQELGSTQVAAGQLEEGLATAELGSECLRKALGPAHPLYATSLINRAAMLSKQAREKEAEELTLEALRILEKDPDQREYMLAVFNYGLTLKRQKKLAAARPWLEKAVAIAEKGSEDQRLMQMLSGLAETLQELNELEAALDASTRALAIAERLFGDAPQVTASLTVHGSILESLGRHEEAAQVLRRALTVLEHPAASPVLREVTRYELARSLWHQQATRPEAVGLVKTARAYFVSRGPNFKDYVAECDEWLAKHPAR